MNAPGSIFGSILLAGAFLVSAPGGASAKCANSTAPGMVLVVDREVVGIFPSTPEGNAQVNVALGAIDPADIWFVSISCHEERHLETGAVVRRQALYVNTKGDVAAQGEAWLREIAEAQAAYRREVGTLAMNLTDLLPRLSYRLRYHIQPASGLTPSQFLQMTATSSGWSATFRVENEGVACHVMGGTIEPELSGLVEGVPQCVVTGEPVARVAPSATLQVRISQ